MRILSVRPAARCVACHDALDVLALQAVCPVCDARGHVDCLTGLRGCPTLGCARRRPVVPSVVFASWPAEPPPPRVRPRRGRIAAAALAFLAVVVPLQWGSVVGQGHLTRVQRVEADLQALRAALERFRADTGREAEQLSELPEGPRTDPWGNEYVYTPGLDRSLVCLGADGAPGGVDECQDLSSRTLNER